MGQYVAWVHIWDSMLGPLLWDSMLGAHLGQYVRSTFGQYVGCTYGTVCWVHIWDSMLISRTNA